MPGAGRLMEFPNSDLGEEAEGSQGILEGQASGAGLGVVGCPESGLCRAGAALVIPKERGGE